MDIYYLHLESSQPFLSELSGNKAVCNLELPDILLKIKMYRILRNAAIALYFFVRYDLNANVRPVKTSQNTPGDQACVFPCKLLIAQKV